MELNQTNKSMLKGKTNNEVNNIEDSFSFMGYKINEQESKAWHETLKLALSKATVS
jgi:hypothetical protein